MVAVRWQQPTRQASGESRDVSVFVRFQDYKSEEDPALFQSAKTGRGPLSPEWKVKDGAEVGCEGGEVGGNVCDQLSSSLRRTS